MGVKQLTAYAHLRIERARTEATRLRESLQKSQEEVKNIKELHSSEEEKYSRLTNKLRAFSEDALFPACNNNDLIGEHSNDFLMTIFIQANTIEEMISNTH